MLEQNDRDFRHAQFARRKNSGVASNDVDIGADQKRIRPAEFLDRSCDGSDLCPAVRARIICPRNQLFNRPKLDSDIDVNRMLRDSTLGRQARL